MQVNIITIVAFYLHPEDGAIFQYLQAVCTAYELDHALLTVEKCSPGEQGASPVTIKEAHVPSILIGKGHDDSVAIRFAPYRRIIGEIPVE